MEMSSLIQTLGLEPWEGVLETSTDFTANMNRMAQQTRTTMSYALFSLLDCWLRVRTLNSSCPIFRT